jgi:AraC-like DNA-binding protein
MLNKMNLPDIRHEEFYIVKFEDYYQFTPENNDSTPYFHDYFEISLGEGHQVTLSLNDNAHDFGERNLAFISPRQKVSWTNHGEQNINQTQSYLVLFKPYFLPFATDVFDVYKKFPFFNHNSKLAYSVPKKLREELFDTLHKIYVQYREEQEDYLEYARAKLTLFLLKAKRNLEADEDANLAKSRAHEITYKFENLVKHASNKRRPTAYYAEKLFVSPVYLSECVKKATNKTVKTIIDEYLVLEIKSMLRKTDEPVAQIALDLGFSDDSNFTKFFRAKTGVTPKGFRKQL